MPEENIQQQLVHVSRHMKQAETYMVNAQGANQSLLEQSHQNLDQAENMLEQLQDNLGETATQNPQFQQAYEKLHDTRQQLDETKKNNNRPLF
jgi:chromosome segregation ATPase